MHIYVRQAMILPFLLEVYAQLLILDMDFIKSKCVFASNNLRGQYRCSFSVSSSTFSFGYSSLSREK